MTRPDRDTFDALVRHHHAAVYRSALRVLRHSGDAEDVAQDVFVRALAGKVQLAGVTEARAALCWLATRLALNALRGARRRNQNENLAAMQNPTTTAAPDPADTELRHSVRRLLNGLPEELRLPLVLRFQDGLTYAAVGTALSIPESTAHDRVQGALARLRTLLANAGFAIAPAGLPALIDVAEPALAPTGLESRLLALGGSVAAVAFPAAKLGLAAALLTSVTAAAFVLATSGGDREPVAAVQSADARRGLSSRPGPRAGAEPNRAGTRTLLATETAGSGVVPAAPQDPMAKRHAIFAGTVRDAESWPVGGARIVAVAAGGLKPFALAEVATDASGAFSLAVPYAGEPVPATRIRIQVLEQTQLLLETAELALRREAEPAPLRLALPARAGTETSRFALTVTVQGPDGTSLAGIPVALYASGEPPPRPGQTAPEVEAVTGADGVARLTGRTPGPKLLFADPRKLGLRAALATVAIDRPGEHRSVLALTPGLALRGRIRVFGGGVPEWANVWLEEESRLCHTGKLGADGAIEFAGLGDGPFTLRVAAHPFSSLALRGVRPGGDPVEVWLKRADDPRDVGNHLAELHGQLRDADTGAAVAFAGTEVEVHRLRAGESTLALDRIEPPRPKQTMVDHKKLTAFHLTGLEPGAWAVCVRVAGYAPATEVFELRDTELRDGLEIVLRRGAQVSGRVVDGDGRPVVRALVFAVGIGDRADANAAGWDAAQRAGERQAAPSSLACSARTDKDGGFALSQVPPSVELRVMVVAAKHAPAATASMLLQPGEVRAGVELRATAR